MMTAADLARKLKEEDRVDQEAAAKAAAESQKTREADEKRLTNLILAALNSFELRVEKRWFAGSNYWTLYNGDTVVCCCVLKYEASVYERAEGCGDWTRGGWGVAVYSNPWGGPASGQIAVMEGITDEGDLNKYVAHAAKDKI